MVQVSDGNGGTDTITVNVTVTAVNDAPVAVDDTGTTPEDTPLVITASTLKANDTDVDNTNGELSVTAVSNPVNGTVGLSSGIITFTPAANFAGTAGFDYTLSDGDATDTGHVSITVTPVNDAPVAVDDTGTTPEDTALLITASTLKANDTDVDNTNGELSVTEVSNPTNGTVRLSSGTITFTPAADFTGTAGFDYTLSDGDATDTGHVSITVTEDNDAPVVTDIPNQTIAEGGTFTTITLDNYVSDAEDTDAQMAWTYSGNSALTITIVGRVATITAPSVDWNGAETITFRATDTGPLYAEDAATFTVTPVNDAPVITGQAVLSTAEDTALPITLTDLTVIDVDNTYPTGFTLTVSAGTNYTFVGNTITPAANFNGLLTVPVKVNDGEADSITFNLTVTVTAVNDAPVVADIPNQTIAEGGVFAIINLDDYVSDNDNSDSQMTWTHSGNTSLTVNYVGRVAILTVPSADWNGAETITFRATDPNDLYSEDAATFTVTAVNDAPVINEGETEDVSMSEDGLPTGFTLTLTASDADAGDTLSWSILTGAANGTAAAEGTGTVKAITYTPSANYTGIDSFVVQVSDGNAGTNTITVNVTITPVNDAPVVADIPNQTITEGAAFTTITLDDYVSDVENTDEQLTWTYSGSTALTVTIVDRVATITEPSADWNGTETITFRVTDTGTLYAEDAATFTVTADNDAPEVADIPNQTIAEGAAFTTINLDGYVSDADNTDAQMAWTYSGNSALTVSIVARVATITAPNADWNGAETITFRATDPGALFAEDAATFTVTPVNDAPVITGQAVLSTAEDTALPITLTDLTVIDVDNTYPTGFTLTVLAGTNYTFVGNTIAPAANFNGLLTVPVKVNDGAADSITFNLTVTVTAVNDAPVCTDVTLTTSMRYSRAN